MARNLHRRRGVWTFRKEINGKDFRVSTGFRDRKAAERRAAELEVAIRSGEYGWTPPPSMTFAAWASRYQQRFGPRKKALARDGQILGHVLPTWGARPLDAITRSECVGYLARREQQGAKPATLNREMGLLKAMFNAAIEDGLLVQNPWRGIRRLRTEARSRVLSVDEQASLMRTLNPSYQRLVTVALGTGLREAELLGLRPRDFDTSARTLYVSADTAKGGKARVVPVRGEVAAALEAQGRERHAAPQERLWLQSGSAVYKCLRDAAKRAGLDPFCVHDLRRTFGTRCATAGMPLPQLQRILGHQSAEITLRYDVHVQQEELGRALARVNLRLGPAEAGTKVVTFARRVVNG